MRSFVPILSRRRGMTLMEVLVTVSLVALIGMVVFASLNNGIKLWQAVNAPTPRADMALFFEKFSQELENVFVLDRASFQGDGATVMFPTSLREKRRAGTWSMGAVRYAYDEKARVLTRGVMTMSDIFEDRGPVPQAVFDHVLLARFDYYYFDTQGKEYVWSEKWPPEIAEVAALPQWPLAVRLKIQWEQMGVVYDFESVFSIPMARP